MDPLRLARATEPAVTARRGGVQLRRYYRIRADRWYGGIATADACGCNLRCAFCWSWSHVVDPGRGRLMAPAEVAAGLVRVAGGSGVRRVRVSGGEPTIGRDHLISLMGELEPSGLLFILETNGILLGADRSYARDLARFDNVHVRVSIKGCSPGEFSRLTGADPEFFDLQLEALSNLLDAGVSCHPAVVVGFCPDRDLRSLLERLAEVDPSLPASVEPEVPILYPKVEDRLRRRGLSPKRFRRPGRG